MSTKVLDIAWDIGGLSLAQKMVLVALADQANDHGEAYPGVESLRRRCSMSERGIYKVIAELQEKNLISRDQLPGKNTMYRLNLDRMLQPDMLDPEALKTPSQRARHSRRVHQVQGCTSFRGARSSGVHEVHPAQNCRTTPAPGAVHKSNQELTATDISGGRAPEAPDDRQGSFEAAEPAAPQEPAGISTAGQIATDLRRRGFRITSMDAGLVEAIREGVTLAAVLEFAELYPADHAKCRGSPGYVISAARRQLAEQNDRAQGGNHADSHPAPRTSLGVGGSPAHGRPRESRAGRFERKRREAEARITSGR